MLLNQSRIEIGGDYIIVVMDKYFKVCLEKPSKKGFDENMFNLGKFLPTCFLNFAVNKRLHRFFFPLDHPPNALKKST